MDKFITGNEQAFFLNPAPNVKFLERLDLSVLVGGEARDKDNLDTVHSFRADPFFRFYYVTGGTVDLIFTDGRFSLRSGFVYLIPASKPFRYVSPTGFTHRWLHFRSSLLDKTEYFRDLIGLKAPENTEELMQEFLHWIRRDASVRTLMEIDIILRKLLIPFFESIPEKNLEKIKDQNRFYPVIDYIDRNAVEPISIVHLAAMLRMNRNVFSAEFRKSFGISPKQYICKSRIGLARELLFTTDLSVKQISGRVGYNNEFFFSRLFKKYTGYPPSVFRNISNLGI